MNARTTHFGQHLASMRRALEETERLLVITGAGCSTASGIGDYRDRSGAWKRASPIQHADFVRDEATRRLYWLRSLYGWPAFRAAEPNATHYALSAWERRGSTVGLITQNVDRLHQQAGQRNVADLHGRLDRVRCLSCDEQSARDHLQERLLATNQSLLGASYAAAPDGDADVVFTPEQLDRLQVPECLTCGGVLKPAVVFYGDGVPKDVVTRCYDWVETCDALLVVGTSLMVFSSFRFCRAAARRGVPIFAVNQGVTRADDLLTAKLDGACEEVLPSLLGKLSDNRGRYTADKHRN